MQNTSQNYFASRYHQHDTIADSLLMEEYYSPNEWVSRFPCIDELNQSFEAKLTSSSMQEPAEAMPENGPLEYNSE